MSRRMFNYLVSLLIGTTSFSVVADSLSVHQGYIRETIPGTKVSSAYFTIQNDSKVQRILVGAKSNFSPRMELHTHLMEEGMMKMRQVENIVIPAGESVTLQPSGLHVMIFDLPNRLVSGEEKSFDLEFKNGEKMAVTLPVKSVKQVKAESDEHHHHHH